MNLGHFYGKVVDEATGKSIDAATVQLLQNKLDTNTRQRKDVVIAVLITSKKGEFSIERLPVMGKFKLHISAVGFKKYESSISFEINMNAAKSGDMSSMLNGVDKDLGNIKLLKDATQLQNVTVNANKPLIQLNLDKKIYNVEKDISATGGTAVDVMKNVPSVNVDIDGNVTMRNASPQIFVDGRPTTLSLDQIPADQIATIEIISNPSAKYDAGAGSAGILNIVLKKNRKSGYNGNIRASIDSRGRPGVGGDINFKQNKFNFFAAGMFGMRKSISEVITNRTDFLSTKTAHLSQNNNPVGKGYFAFGRLGMDYFIDNRNTITISGNYSRGQFENGDLIDIYRDTVTATSTIFETGKRNLMSKSHFRNIGSSAGFKHNFSKSGKEWTADANYNFSRNRNTSDYNGLYFDQFNQPKTTRLFERSTGGGDTKFLTLQTDYTDPISSTQKLEAGLRMSQRRFKSFNDNLIDSSGGLGQYILLPALGVNYDFKDDVYAAYATYSQQIKNVSIQLGARIESSSYTGNLLTKNQQFSNDYPLSLFPSAFFTWKLNKKADLQLNYSRKINRPGFFQLIPFIDFSDSLNLSIGNPNLKPEFNHLGEIVYSQQFSAGQSILLSIYGRVTDNLITRYQYIDSSILSKPARFTSFANASRSVTTGVELTSKNKVGKNWDITTNINLYNTNLTADNLPGTSNNEQFSWFAKMNNSFKLPANFSIQLTGDYQSKTLVPAASGSASRGGGGGNFYGGGPGFGQTYSTAQGYIKPIYGADIAIKKEFLKNNAASLTLQFNDIFRTRLYATRAANESFNQDYSRRRDPQVLRLNFNWRFGKLDVNLFKRKNMKGEMENMQNMQQGVGQ